MTNSTVERAAAHLREHHVKFWGGGMEIHTGCPENPPYPSPGETMIIGSENWPHVIDLFRVVLGVEPEPSR